METITLQFESSLSVLAGNQYGRKVFDEQVKPYISNNLACCVIFPEHITYVYSSFVQGFFSHWLETIGVTGIINYIDIKSKHKEVIHSIINDIM